MESLDELESQLPKMVQEGLLIRSTAKEKLLVLSQLRETISCQIKLPELPVSALSVRELLEFAQVGEDDNVACRYQDLDKARKFAHAQFRLAWERSDPMAISKIEITVRKPEVVTASYIDIKTYNPAGEIPVRTYRDLHLEETLTLNLAGPYQYSLVAGLAEIFIAKAA